MHFPEVYTYVTTAQSKTRMALPPTGSLGPSQSNLLPQSNHYFDPYSCRLVLPVLEL